MDIKIKWRQYRSFLEEQLEGGKHDLEEMEKEGESDYLEIYKKLKMILFGSSEISTFQCNANAAFPFQ